MSIKDRLIQFVLRGKDELSPEAKKSAEALEQLKNEAASLGKELDNAKGAQGLAKALENTRRVVEQAQSGLADTEQRVVDLRAALSASPEAAGLQQSLTQAEREASRMRGQLRRLTDDLAKSEQAAKAAGIDTEKLGDEHGRLGQALDNAKAKLADNASSVKALEREQNRAARATAEHEKSQESLSGMLSSGAKKIGALVAAYVSINAAIGLVRGGLRLLAGGLRAVAMDGSERQQALAQLEATLASTGRQAEFTAKQLLDMADAVEASSMLTAEQVQAAQARLLSYTDVAANEFPRALQIVIDQQQRLGISVEQSAEIVGRALQSPAQAMAALGRQGFKLEDGQKRLLKQLEATGKTAEAQSIIMDMLTEAYGGSAAAARMNTAAGLWKGLTDRVGDFATRVANSGAFEFMQRKLLELSNYLDAMAKDGRLDELAGAISKAFIEGAERAEVFAKKLLEIDFANLTNDASAWLDRFGEKLDTTGRWITLITAPFRVLVNVVTGGISAIGVAFAGVIGTSLALVSQLARVIPDAFGGPAIVAGLESARDTALSMMKVLAGQVAQDGRDIAATWDSVASAAESSADRQVKAAQKAAEETRRSMQQTGDDIAAFFRSNITSIEQALAAISFAETSADLAEVEAGLKKASLTADEMAEAMTALEQKRGFVTVGDDAKRTTTELEHLRQEQARLSEAYNAGTISLQQWQEGHNAAAAAIRKLEEESRKVSVTAVEQSGAIGRLRAEQSRLREAYDAGTISLQQWQEGHNAAALAIRNIENASGGAASSVNTFGQSLKSLADVQRAIGDAKTDRDITAIRTALQGLYDTGQVGAAQYNTELSKLNARQKELKGAVEQGTKAQRDKNAADKDAIVTSEQLRRESGKRMEAERKAGDEAMQRRRKESSDAQRDVSAMEGFFGGVVGRAREAAAALSREALAAFDALRGISGAAPSIDTGSLDDTAASLSRVAQALGAVRADLAKPMQGTITRWMLETQEASLKTQAAFLGQKRALQSLMQDYESGGLSAQRFIARANGMRRAMSLLDGSDLSSLESAIAAAEQRMRQMNESTRSTLESLQDELDSLQGRTEDIERRRYAARRRELEAQLAEANAGGDSQAVANASRALGMLRQVEAEAEQQRQREAQQKRIEQNQAAAPAAQPEQVPQKVIRLEIPGRPAVDVAVSGDNAETNLLNILEQAGLRSL